MFKHRVQVKELGAEVGVRFLTLGFDPTTATEHVPIMPKNRYDIMRAYMPTRGTLGLDMMLRSCTIQVRRQPSWACRRQPLTWRGLKARLPSSQRIVREYLAAHVVRLTQHCKRR